MQRVEQPVPCARCPLLDCPGLRPLTPEQLAYMQDFKQGEVRAEVGEKVVSQGQVNGSLFTILEGVLIRYRELEDGRRQIVNFMFPGDLVGMQGAFEEPSAHAVEVLLEAQLCVFDRRRFHRLIADMPDLGFDLTWLAAKEEAALEEHIVALGRRSARERVAYLAVWLVDRAQSSCVSPPDGGLVMSVTQSQIADMLGLSLVHTNRTIKSLQREGLVLWHPREIIIPDMAAASEFARFDRSLNRVRPYI